MPSPICPPLVGVVAACDFLGVARATFYRQRPLLGPSASPQWEPDFPADPAPPLRANMDETDHLVVITEQGENRNPCVKNNGISSASPASPPVLPAAAQRREAERSEADPECSGRQNRRSPKRARPAPTGPGGRRRCQASNFHRRIQTAHPGRCRRGCRSPRRDRCLAAARRPLLLAPGHLWRRRRRTGILKGLIPLKRGPKSKRSPAGGRKPKAQGEENHRLTEELRKAEIVIDVQKKVGALLGWPLPKADPEEQP